MTYLTIGQVNIPVVWLAFFVAIFYADYRNRKGDATTNKWLERLVYTYIGVWKLSYVLFSWSDFAKAPLSLVYFDGGLKGHLLALGGLTIIVYRKRQQIEWQELWTYWARFVSVFGIISAGFQEQWLFAVSWFTLLIMIERAYKHGLLLIQLLLLVWLYGFLGSLTLAHSVVLLMLVLKSKQVQYAALAVIMSLVATMLGDVSVNKESTERLAIELITTTGEMYRLEEQSQSLTVVNFFATWCPPCKAEMPHLQSFAEDLPKGVELIGVNLTERDDGEQALVDFMSEYDVTYPILLDETDEVGTAYNVMSIPTTVLLNAAGEELTRIVGPISEEGLRELVKKYQE